MSDEFRKELLAAQRGDRLALARALSWAERLGPKALEVSELLRPNSRAFRIGITGPPGAGKSTLVGALLPKLRAEGLKIGVLAVDPSSPFTKGAILGDRIRYGEFVGDAKVFVRSLGTRGSLGGLCASAYLMLRVFDACGFDVVLIETVGVGQTELDVMFVADEITVVVVPESGDSIQAMKAGLLEIADLFVVNKSDRPGADAMVRELEWVSEGREKIPVIQAAATLGRGIDEIFAHWMSRRQKSASSAGSGHEGRTPLARLRHEALALARSSIEEQLRVQMANIHDEESFLRITKLRLQIQT